LSLYERSLGRYGRGLSAVRQRVCLGCRLTLPTSAAPPPGLAQLHLCEGCGRLLLWD
jgi:predicted  nucleic acid-binding Zn-ribbon protein